jgi:hypothetical protein
MLGQHRDRVEDALAGRVGTAELERHGVRVDLLDPDRLSVDQQQGPICRAHLRVEVDLEAEDNVVGVEGLAVREQHVVAEIEGIAAAVLGDRPRFRQGGLGPLGQPVDVDEVAVGQVADLFRRPVGGDDRVQGTGLGAQRRDQASAPPADLAATRNVRAVE